MERPRPYKVDRKILSAMSLEKLLAAKTHWFSTRVHTGERPYKCGEYGKTSSCKPILAQHRRIHTGEMLYACGTCGKVFNHSSNLVVHQRVHTDARPSKCSECGKAYSHKSTLAQHESVHSGERPYECSECGKYFGHKYRLIKHWSVHTGARPYERIACGKFFSQSFDLVAHQRMHNGEKPFLCKSVERPPATNTCSFSITESTLEKGHIGAASVGRLLGRGHPSSDTAKFTLEKGLSKQESTTTLFNTISSI